ncbi:4-hydroxyphenylpyruvate dioxygenase [Chondrocystis sp. NIES-4102]|nr:4-hydroxyphenylpyruvate dioxygenase [Chondrocystis sp. NIES-4102]
MKIDHVHFYTRNAATTKDWFIDNIGFKAQGKSINQHTHTEVIALNSVFLVFSSPLSLISPVAQYLNSHPSGVVDIAFRVDNLQTIINKANDLGVEVLHPPKINQQFNYKYAKVLGWNSLQHTLIETTTAEPLLYYLPEITIDPYQAKSNLATNITDIDHIVLNVRQGSLQTAVARYQALFDFKIQQSFKIKTSNSGLSSEALVDQEGEVQFNINEPTTANSQIQEFIDYNHGSGIQHLALRSHDLIADIAQIRQHELNFLTIPPTYYQQLERLCSLTVTELQAIARQQILIDSDQTNPQSLLMQIFTQPIFEQPTFFLEFIERRQAATGFGQGNFQSLFAAVEREQIKRGNQS